MNKIHKIINRTIRSASFKGWLSIILLVVILFWALPTMAQNWTYTGSMSTDRRHATVTVLPDGRVLVVGGVLTPDPTPGVVVFLATAEIYDPSTGLFTPTGSLTTGTRALHTATLLNDGKVLVAGGYRGGGGSFALTSAEIYDPDTGVFTATNGLLNIGRSQHAATLFQGGRVLITGGHHPSADTRQAELYDPATGIFTTTVSMTYQRNNHTATLLQNGDVLVAGGVGQNTAEVFNYHVDGDSFSLPITMNSVRCNHSATLLANGQVLLAGGSDGSSSLSTAELYTDGTGFSSTGNLATARQWHAATSRPDGKVLIAGGNNSAGGDTWWYGQNAGEKETYLNSIELYDPDSSSFTPFGHMNSGRSMFQLALLNNGGVLAAGGGYASAELWVDTDNDSMPDDWEKTFCLNPYDPNDAYGDPDSDGLWNRDEYWNGTYPDDPDSDGDKISDSYELNEGTDPTDPASFPDIPLHYGAVTNVHQPDDSFETYLEVAIGKDFVGILPDDIDLVTVTLPDATTVDIYPNPECDYYPTYRSFFIARSGSPQDGTYEFTVNSGTLTGTISDSQAFPNIDIDVMNDPTFTQAEGGTLSSKNPTFFWNPVTSPIATIFYRLDVVEEESGEPGDYVYRTGQVEGMLSHTVPNGILNPGQTYMARVRANDNQNFVQNQNRSHSRWVPFTVERDPKRLAQFSVIVGSGNLLVEFDVLPGFTDKLDSAVLSFPNPSRLDYTYDLDNDTLFWDTECRYLNEWDKSFGAVQVPDDYGAYELTLKFSDGAKEVYTRNLQQASVSPVSNIKVTVYDDGWAFVIWDQPSSGGSFNYQVRVRDDADKEYFRIRLPSNERSQWLSAWDLRCLTKGQNYQWLVRVFDLNSNAMMTSKILADYSPRSIRHTEQYMAYSWRGNLALGFDTRPGSRDQIDSVIVTGPDSFSYTFDLNKLSPNTDWSPMATETRLGMDLWWHEGPWPITSGDYTFTAEYDENGNSTIDHTEVLTRSLDVVSVSQVNVSSMSADIKPTGAIDFSWTLPVLSGQLYQVSIRDVGYTKDYYRSSNLYDINQVTASFWDLRGLKHGERYQWFVRAFNSNNCYETIEQSAPQFFVYNPFDTDSDGFVDQYDAFPGDPDGWSDTDNDGMPDEWEGFYGLDKNLDDSSGDGDNDGLSNLDEYLNDTDPNAASDTDGDDYADYVDNCPDDYNDDQADWDGDDIGDACDDSDGDGQMDALDPYRFDPDNDTLDSDGVPADPNGLCFGLEITICQNIDNCPEDYNPGQENADEDALGDACDDDLASQEKPCRPEKDPGCSFEEPVPDEEVCTHSDNDDICDEEDNCPEVNNPYDVDTDGDDIPDAQRNTDGDGEGDACDPDDDGDDILESGGSGPCVGGNTVNCDDNCPLTPNSDQADLDCNFIGDACDPDIDGDGISNDAEYPIGTYPNDADTDNDGYSDGGFIPIDCNNIYDPPVKFVNDETPLGDEKFVEFVEVYADADCNRKRDNSINIIDTWLPVPREDATAIQQPDDPPTWIHSRCIEVVAKLYDPSANNYVPFGNDVTFILSPTRKKGVATNHSEECPGFICPVDYSFIDSQNEALTGVLDKTVSPSGDTVSLHVFSFDYGGSFTITATTPVSGGYDSTGKVTLPLDSDNDGAPDIVEKHYGFDETDPYSLDPGKTTLDGDMDVDTLLYNPYPGDGLTNNREWRAVIYDAEGTIFERLNPKKMDLFVRGDFYQNSICPNKTTNNPDVLDFTLEVTTDPVNNPDNHNAFENAGINVHDVTGDVYYCQEPEPPYLDILVVTNKALVDGQNFDTLGGQKDGYINHPSPNYPRYWKWDVKGASFIGTAWVYALNQVTGEQSTETYHSSLMNYIYNRPYINDISDAWLNPAQNECLYSVLDSPLKLDPLSNVEDFLKENGGGPDRAKGGLTEDICLQGNRQVDGDKMDHPGWMTAAYPGSDRPYKTGFHFSIFDADADGYVELPVVDTPADVMALNPNSFDQLYEFYPIQVQTQTIIHEMGHGLGVSANHVADQEDVMYVPVLDWNHAWRFTTDSIEQFHVHNQ